MSLDFAGLAARAKIVEMQEQRWTFRDDRAYSRLARLSFWMPSLKNISLDAKLNLLVLTAACGALILAFATLALNDYLAFRAEKVRQFSSLANMLGDGSGTALVARDSQAATEWLSSLRTQTNVDFACLFDMQGKMLAEYGAGAGIEPGVFPRVSRGYEFTAEGHLDVTEAVFRGGKQVGWICLRADTSALAERMANNAKIAAIAAMISLSGAVLLCRRFQYAISSPISVLVKAARRASNEGDYSLRVERRSSDELGLLYRELNRLLERLGRGERDLKKVREELDYRVKQRTRQLSRTNVEFSREIAERKRAERQLESMHGQLMEAARQTGMAEIATGVLHNVGNVLNSVNVSCSLLNDRLRTSKVLDLARAAEMIKANQDQLATFFDEDEKGRLLPEFLVMLAEHLNQERDVMVEELHGLIQNVDHVKTIVSMQQSFAGVAGVVESVSLESLIEDALKLNKSSFDKYGMEVVREYADMPRVNVEKQRILQVLVNLITNAKDALGSSANPHPKVTIRTSLVDEETIKIEVSDNGIGIAEKDITSIFSHGFTTKEHGHGFGLHMSANAAKEMGGRLTAHSDGPATGATFTIELPFVSAEAAVASG